MKLSITLYGSTKLNEITNSKESLADTFGKACHIRFFETLGTIPVKISVEMRELVIPRTFMADATVEFGREARAEDESVLNAIAEEVGNLWAEYVNTFIDNGSLKAVRVATTKLMVKWYPVYH